MRRAPAAAALAVALAVGSAAQAQSRGVAVRRAAADDTLVLLAAEYYGDRRHAAMIQLANGLDEARPLRRGERIRVPVGQRVVTRAGDRLGELAAEHLGDERRAEFLAEYNDLPPDAPLAAGMLLRVPFHLEYSANEPTSLRVLAARYLRGASDEEVLRAYNFLDDDARSLDAGDSILVPAIHVAVRSARLPSLGADARNRVETRRAVQQQAEAALPSVRHAWRRGEYDDIERRLAPIERAYLDADIAAEVSLFLGGAHIARGELDAAEDVFREALARDPDYAMSAYHFSPAIRAVWEKLGGRIDTSSR